MSEPNYRTTKWFSECLLEIGMKKIKVKTNKPVYLGLSILEISKISMYEFWYNYIKPKYQDNARLCYMDTDSFIIYIKTEDVYKGIADYEVKRPLSTEKNKKVIGLMKDELGEKIMVESAALRSNTYSYLMDDGKNDKKAKGAKKCVIEKYLNLMVIKIAY